MTWSKFDDAAPKSPKAVTAGNDAWALWAAAVMYCNRHLTDGYVTIAALANDCLPVPIPLTRAKKLAEELCDAVTRPGGLGLFERTEREHIFMVHDFLDWNPSKAEVESKRKADRERKRKPSGLPQDSARNPNELHVGVPTDSETPRASARALPDPTRPDPTQPEDQTPQPPSGVEGTDPNGQLRATVRGVFAAWAEDTGHLHAVLDRKRGNRIAARLREGFTREQLVEAIRNRRHDPFLMGANDTGKVYDGVETLLRDAAQVERLLALSSSMGRVARQGQAHLGANVERLRLRAERLEREEQEATNAAQ